MTRREQVLASAVASALEALDSGDQRHAVEILLSAQEDAARRSRLSCPDCGLRCRWPGQLAHHLAAVHGVTEAA